MPIHRILTEHPAVSAARKRITEAEALVDEASTKYRALRAGHEADKQRALAAGKPLPPELGSDPSNALRDKVRAEQQAAKRVETEVVCSQTDELRDALAERQGEIFAQVPELVAPLRALADELLELGHTAQTIDRANGVTVSRAAGHVIGLDELVAAVADGSSFLGFDTGPPARPRPPGRRPWVTVRRDGRDVSEGGVQWRTS